MSAIIFPGPTTWITPRSLEIKITTDNCVIILPQKIDSLNQVLLNGNGLRIHIQFRLGDSASEADINLDEIYLDTNGNKISFLDISKWVVEKSKYNTLPLISGGLSNSEKVSVLKNNSWYYEHKSNIIVLCNERLGGWLFQSAVFSRIVEAGVLSLGTTYVKEQDGTYHEIMTLYVPTTTPLYSAEFRVHYTPLGESVKLHVPKTNPQKHPFAIPYSQQQPIVNNETLGREMQSVANRTGCELKDVIRTIPDIKYLRKLGTVCYEKDANGNKTGNVWRLTKNVIYIWGDTFIQVLETWSKNWSYRSENVPINREFRSWNIPADIVQRNMSWQDYCLLTTKQEITLPPTALISEEAKQELLRGLESSFNADKYTECTNMWFKYLSNTPTGIGAVFTCSAFGFGNSLIFTGKTKDNLSAGVQRVPADDNDRNNQFCKDVYYCQDDGTAQSLDIQIASEINPGNDPEAVYLYPQSGSDYNLPTGLMLFNNTHPAHIGNYIRFNVLKDPSEQLNFTYQLNLMTDSGQLVIGASWAESNPLVKERKENKTIKVWKLNLYIPGAAKVMTDYYGSEYSGSQSDLFEVDRANGTITFKPVTDGVGVCVTDEYNNVLIGFNGNEGATFYAKYTHDYKAIYASLKNRGVSTY